jgi:hypothetical protein
MTIRYTHGSRSLYRLYHVVVDVSLEGEALCGFDLRGLTILPLTPAGMNLCPFCERRLGRLHPALRSEAAPRVQTRQRGRCFAPLKPVEPKEPEVAEKLGSMRRAAIDEVSRTGRLTGLPFVVRFVRKPAPAPRNDADYSEPATRRSGRLDSDREFLVAPLERHSVARLLYLDVG